MRNNIITLFNGQITSGEIKKVIFNTNIDTIKLFTITTIETFHVAHMFDKNNIYIVDNSFQMQLHIDKKAKKVYCKNDIFADETNYFYFQMLWNFVDEMYNWGYTAYFNYEK